MQNKKTFIILKKRRYVCKNCGKRFFENLDFLPKYHRITNRLVAYIISELSCISSMSSVASKANVSSHTVKRIFDMVSYST
ncbi:helix-turn-helix domain-containing protein, partial [Caloramator fervidus]|uniref:helix-turn-helix domain-containing protein n=1 Tax=Caloramator fervidus TaxID=29344 RepID=UPI003BFA6EC8